MFNVFPTPFPRDADAKAASERARKFQQEANALQRKARGSSSGSNSNSRAGSCACDSRNAGCCRVGGDAHATARVSRGHHHPERDASRLEKELEEQRGAFAVARAENDKLQAALEVWIRGGGGALNLPW